MRESVPNIKIEKISDNMKKTIGFLPYRTMYNRDDNLVFRFEWSGTNLWDVTIVIDELNDGLVVDKNCTCSSKTRFKKEKDCKHILAALNEMRTFNVEFREDEL